MHCQTNGTLTLPKCHIFTKRFQQKVNKIYNGHVDLTALRNFSFMKHFRTLSEVILFM
mgnify:CR=1 FL=1